MPKAERILEGKRHTNTRRSSPNPDATLRRVRDGPLRAHRAAVRELASVKNASVAGNLAPTPKQLSTARHRKNTQRRSFPRQRKTHLSEECPYQKTLSKKRVAPSPAFLLPRRQSCPHIDPIIALRRGLKGSPRRGKGTGAERTLQAEGSSKNAF